MNAPNSNLNTSAQAGIDAALQQFSDPQCDPVALLRGLMDAIRPADRRDGVTAAVNWRAMNAALAANDAYRQAVSAKLLELFATRRLVTFFAEEGILPPTGFFSELWGKIVHKVLPELRDDKDFKDCLDLILYRRNDHVWFSAIPMEDKLAFWRSLDWRHAPDQAQVIAVNDQLLEALLIVAHRTLALSFHPELRRVCPEVEESPSPFRALHQELTRFVDQCRASWNQTSRQSAAAASREDKVSDRHQPAADGRQDTPAAAPAPEPGVLKSLTLCRLQLSHAYTGTLIRGVSLPLTYLLTQLEQHLDRLSLLYRLFSPRTQKEGNAQVLDEVDGFMRTTVIGERQRNSVLKHVSDLMGLLALRITENASRTGEHYITSDWPSLRTLWRSAMGAGFVIAFMALFKIYVYDWHLPDFANGVVNSLNYGLGFVLIALVHFTIATKQPAMTAAKISNAIHSGEGELREDENLVSLIVDTLRSQVAAILGNVVVVVVTATAIAWFYSGYLGRPVVDEAVAHHLLDDVNPLGGTVGYAAIAGVWLFVAGLIAGFFDNMATYGRIGERIGSLHWLGLVAGRARAQRFGAFVDQNLGTVMGNFLFGCMLGMTGAFGKIFHLPIEVRHVTFSSANLAYALAALNYDMPAGAILKGYLGVALIGLTNLTVSFTLALYVALRSRGATFASVPSLVIHVGQRVVRHPMRLLLPPRGAVAKH